MMKSTRKLGAKAALTRQAEGIDVLAELAALKAMTVPDLQGKWRVMFGEHAPNASRGNLELRVGYRIQELAHGGIKPATRRTLDALAAEVATGAPGPLIADPRRPIPGTKLVREWQGEEQVVTVLTDGFEWQGRRFKPLSPPCARSPAATGTGGSSSSWPMARRPAPEPRDSRARAPPAMRHLHPQVERRRARHGVQ